MDSLVPKILVYTSNIVFNYWMLLSASLLLLRFGAFLGGRWQNLPIGRTKSDRETGAKTAWVIHNKDKVLLVPRAIFLDFLGGCPLPNPLANPLQELATTLQHVVVCHSGFEHHVGVHRCSKTRASTWKEGELNPKLHEKTHWWWINIRIVWSYLQTCNCSRWNSGAGYDSQFQHPFHAGKANEQLDLFRSNFDRDSPSCDPQRWEGKYWNWWHKVFVNIPILKKHMMSCDDWNPAPSTWADLHQMLPCSRTQCLPLRRYRFYSSIGIGHQEQCALA